MIAIEDNKPARCQSLTIICKSRNSKQQNKKTKNVRRSLSHDETCQKFKDMVISSGYSVNKKGWITRTDFMLGL